MKNLLNLGKTLSRSEQQEINGGIGHGRCPQVIAICLKDSDCCNGRCGFIVDGPNGPINFGGVCAF